MSEQPIPAGYRIDGGFRCPHCDGHIDRYIIVYQGFGEKAKKLDPLTKYLSKLDAEGKLLVEVCQKEGLVAAFSRAHEKQVKNKPAVAEKALLRWFDHAKEWGLPIHARLFYSAAYSTDAVRAVAANGVVGIIAGEALREFVPKDHMLDTASANVANGKVRIGELTESQSAISGWHRGKFGYVPVGAGTFAEAMRVRSAGGFDIGGNA